MRKAFLSGWNGRSFFLDSTVTSSPDLELYTDAISLVGFGGYFNGQWYEYRIGSRHYQLGSLKGRSLLGLATSLGYLTTSLILSPTFGRTFPGVGSQATKNPCTFPPSLRKRFRRTQSGDWHGSQPHLWVR